MAGFVFAANLNVQIDQGSLRRSQADISRTLGGMTVPLSVSVSPSAQAALNGLSQAAANLRGNFTAMSREASAASSALASAAAGMTRYATAAASASASSGQVATAVRSTAAALREGGTQAEYFGHQMRLSVQRFVAFTASVGGMMSVVRLFRESVAEAVNFERQMVKISQVTTEGSAAVAAIGEEVGRVAVQWGVSSKQLVGVAEQLKQTGLSAKEVQAALEPLAKASLAPSFGDMTKTTQGAIAVTRQFGIDIRNLESALGSINAVAQNFAVESNDLIEAAKRAGGAFAAAGGNFHEFNAAVTAVRATTRQSAEVIATGLRTVFTRLQRPEAIEGLKQLGVQLQYTRREAEQLGDLKLEGQFVGPLEAVRRIGQELRGVRSTDPRFAAIAEEVGGYRQISQVIPLLQQQRLVQDALNVSMAGGVSLTAAAEKAQGALFVQAEKVRQEFMTLGRNVLASDGFRAFVADALRLASALATVLDYARPLLPVLMAMATVRIGQSLGAMFAGAARGPLPGRYHSGGPVPGTGERPAVLEGGEYVLNRRAVGRIGRGTLDAVNFAGGGQASNDVPALLALRQDPRMQAPTRTDVRLLKLTPAFQGAATRYVNSRVATLEADRPPTFDVSQRRTLEGILFERYMVKHLTDFNPGKGLDFPTLDVQSRKTLGRLTGEDVSDISGVELKRTATARNLEATVRKSTFADGGVVDARVMPGEFIFGPEQARRIGVERLRRMNDYGQFAGGGLVPGSGNTDSVAMALPAGSFVIRKRSVERLGADNLARLAQQYAAGGPVHLARGGPEQASFGSFDPADFGSFVAAVRAEAERLRMALSATTQVFVKFGATGPVFAGFVEDIKAASGAAKATFGMGQGAVPLPRLNAEQSRLVEDHLDLPGKVVRSRKAWGFAKSIGVDEAESAAQMAMVRAAATFDPSKGVPFSAYAAQPMRSAVMDAAAERQGMKRSRKAGGGFTGPGVRLTGEAFELEGVGKEDGPSGVEMRELTRQLEQAKKMGLDQAKVAAAMREGTLGQLIGGPAAPAQMDPRIERMRQAQRRRQAAQEAAQPAIDRATAIPAGAIVPYAGGEQGRALTVPPRATAGGGPPQLEDHRHGIVRSETGVGDWNDPNVIDAEFTVRPRRRRLMRQNGVVPSPGTEMDETFDSSPRVRVYTRAPLYRRLDGPDDTTYRTMGDDMWERRQPRPAKKGRRMPDPYGFAPEDQSPPIQMPATPLPAPYGVQPHPDDIKIAGADPTRLRQYADEAAAKAKQRELYGPRADFRQDSIGNLAQKRALAEMERMGGRDRLSQDTRNAVLLDQHARVQQEAVAVTARQILAQGKAATATEARKMAEERYAQALARGEKVVTERGTGRTLGFADNVEAMVGSGRRPDGRWRATGWLADRWDGVRTGAGRFAAGVSSLNDRIAVPFGGRAGLNTAVFVASSGMSYLGAGLETAGGTAEHAVAGGTEGGYRGYKTAGGALTGAAAGAAIGSILPGVGTAFGAVAGAAIGLVSSFQSAGADIRSAKLGNALNEFGTKLNALSSGFGGAGEAAGALAGIRTAREQMQGNATTAATGWWGLTFDAQKYGGVLQKEERQAFSGQVPAMSRVLTEFAESMVKRNPAAPLDSLLVTLRQGNAGLNAELLRIIASLRGVPVAALEEEWRKTLLNMRAAALAERDTDRGRQADERGANSWGRLVAAVEAAAGGLDDFRVRARTVADLFDGQAGAAHVGSYADAFGRGGDRQGFADAAGIVGAVGGDLGGRFRESAIAANAVHQVLPAVLNAVAGTRGLTDDQPVVRARGLLAGQLGYANVEQMPAQLRAAVESVIGGLSRLKPEEFYKKTATDTTKLGQELESAHADPLRDAGQKVVRDIQGEANRFSDGLAESFRRQRAIGDTIGRGDQTRLAGVRQEAAFRAEATGRKHDALDLIPLEELQRPFQARQERLTGEAGPLATDPEHLNRRLGDVRRRTLEATTAQEEAFKRTGGKGPEYDAAAINLARLKDESARLQQALGHLANASERTAGAQEKLAKIQVDKDSRLSFGQRYLTAGADERMQMNRGMLLARSAAEAGSLRGLAMEDQRLVVQTLQGLGQAKLTGFKGQPNAADLLTNLTRDFMGEAAQDPANRQAEAGLKADVLKGYRDADTANRGLVDNQQALQQTFFAELKASHDQFFARLATTLAQQQVGQVQALQGQAQTRMGEIQTIQGHRQVLAGAGITTDQQLENVQRNRGVYEKLAAARQDIATTYDERRAKTAQVVKEAGEEVAARGGTGDTVGYSAFHGRTTRALLQRLKEEAGAIDPAAVASEFKGTAQRRLAEAGLMSGNLNDPRTRSPEAVRIIQESLRAALLADAARQRAAKEATGLAPVQEEIRQKGLDPNLLSGGNADRVLQALKGLEGKTFAGLDKEAADTAATLARLNQELQALRGIVAGQPATPGGPRFASGGVVTTHPGRPSGTDTVPAWLTPEEFVVNPASARANLALLHAINAARGPLHLATGGDVDEQLRRQALANPYGGSAQMLLGNRVRSGYDREWKRLDRRWRRQGDLTDWQRKKEKKQKEWLTQAGETDLSLSLAEQEFVGQAAGLRSRQLAAQFAGHPLAAFGLGLPGMEDQASIAAAVAGMQTDRNRETPLPDPKMNERLRRGRAFWVNDLQRLPAGFANGGLVPGSFTGATDDVPARLTRGEYVLSRPAVQSLGLAAVDRLHHLARGGRVQYLAEGGVVGGPSASPSPAGGGDPAAAFAAFNAKVDTLTSAFNAFGGKTDAFGGAVNLFGSKVDAFASAVEKMPARVAMENTGRVEVILNGGAVLAKLQEGMQAYIGEQINAAIRTLLKERLPDA